MEAGREQSSVECAFDQVKSGNWGDVLDTWMSNQRLASACSRYQNQFSGWTFLHQAAFFCDDKACRELIRLGADPGARSNDDQTAADIATKYHHLDLARVLRQAILRPGSCWSAPKDPDLLPSSNRWGEAMQRLASQTRRVAYADAEVLIPAGSRYYVDSVERTLIGWHGTYDPPSGMDGEPLI